MRNILLMIVSLFLGAGTLRAQTAAAKTEEVKTVSGVVLTEKNEAVVGATVAVETDAGTRQVLTNGEGAFSLAVPAGTLKIKVSGKYVAPSEQTLSASALTTGLQLYIHYAIAPLHESMVITASALESDH